MVFINPKERQNEKQKEKLPFEPKGNK